MMSGSRAATPSSFFSGLFGQAPGASEPPESVLAEWNKYSESAAGPSQSDKLMNQMEEGTASVQNFIASSLDRVTAGAKNVGSSVGSGVSSYQMPSGTQLTYFAAFLGGGLTFLVLAFTLFLPVIMLSPSKFALCFTLGSVLVMAAFAGLRGWRNQYHHMVSRDRLLFTLAYLGSMGGTLYAALAMHSYVMSLICCAAQVVALLYYTLSYFPGGTTGVKIVVNMAAATFFRCIHGLQKAVFG